MSENNGCQRGQGGEGDDDGGSSGGGRSGTEHGRGFNGERSVMASDVDDEDAAAVQRDGSGRLGSGRWSLASSKGRAVTIGVPEPGAVLDERRRRQGRQR